MSKHDIKEIKEKEERKAIQEIDKAQKEPMSPKKKGIIAAAILGPILAVYLGGVAFFCNYFVPNTTFDGKDFSFKEPAMIAEAMEEDTVNRKIVLKKIDGEESLSLHEDINYVKWVEDPEGGWIKGRTSWGWPMYLFMENELPGKVNVEYEKGMLDSVIDNLDAMNPGSIRKPKDAYLGRNGAIYEIVPEDLGNEIIREKLYAVLEDGIDHNMDELDLVELNCYTKPKIYRDDPGLIETLEKYKSINFQKITLDMTGAQEVLETPDILKFYDAKGLSKDKVVDYVKGLQKKYDTYEEPRTFMNSYGNEITVGTRADTYGFLLDVDSTVEQLYKLMKDKKSEDIEPVWFSTGWTRTENGSDIGDTYIEVCIDSQRLWAYQKGELVAATDVVSGMYGKYDTPRGVFAILIKDTDTHLKGQEKLPDGKIEKWDSFVNFWMALNYAGIGLHNAPWRGAFGGTIYQGGGSHGCVNMDYGTAQYLYDNYPYGTPVIIW